MVVFLAVAYVDVVRRGTDRGLTSEAAFLITFLLGALAINLAVVGYMIWLLTETRRRRAVLEKAAEIEGP